MTTDTQDPDAPKLIQVSAGCWVRQEIDNIGWIDMGDWLLVVDALERPELEGEVFSLLADTAGDKKARIVVNTHTHYDHVALNGAFEARHAAEIVSAQTRDIPEDGLWFGDSGRRAQVLPMPGCHTAEDCVVWLPEDSILFPGDIFGWGLIPWDRALTAEKRDHLLATYRRLIDFGAKTVVPGHGPLCSTRELARWVEYFEWLLATVGDAFAKGLDDAAVEEAVPPPEDMHTWWRFLQWKHADSVSKVLRAVRRERL